MKYAKRKRLPSKVEVESPRWAKADDDEARRRYAATERLKRSLIAGQCPHTDNNYCEYCIGDR